MSKGKSRNREPRLYGVIRSAIAKKDQRDPDRRRAMPSKKVMTHLIKTDPLLNATDPANFEGMARLQRRQGWAAEHDLPVCARAHCGNYATREVRFVLPLPETAWLALCGPHMREYSAVLIFVGGDFYGALNHSQGIRMQMNDLTDRPSL